MAFSLWTRVCDQFIQANWSADNFRKTYHLNELYNIEPTITFRWHWSVDTLYDSCQLTITCVHYQVKHRLYMPCNARSLQQNNAKSLQENSQSERVYCSHTIIFLLMPCANTEISLAPKGGVRQQEMPGSAWTHSCTYCRSLAVPYCCMEKVKCSVNWPNQRKLGTHDVSESLWNLWKIELPRSLSIDGLRSSCVPEKFKVIQSNNI